jgi:CRISPR-associated protein Csy1
MLDSAIKDFLNDRKEKWLKNQINGDTKDDEKAEIEHQAEIDFSLEKWLPDAAKRAKQLSAVSHPGKFCHPSAKISSVIAKRSYSNDGFLRTGNIEIGLDVFGNAAAMDVFKFLSLILEDNVNILTHLENNTPEIRKQLTVAAVSFEEIAQGLLSIKGDASPTVKTSSLVKQVYFVVDNTYHLLSILTPSNIMFKLKERIDHMRFSDEAKEAREAKKKNNFSSTGFSEIYDLSVIGFGGTKPQNISVLNSQNGGKAYLLASMPPVLAPRNIQPPKMNFFSNTIWPNTYKIDFQKIHTLLIGDLNNMHIRNKRDRITKSIIYQVVDKMWMIRNLDIGWSESENYVKLPKYQKIWLDQRYSATRNENQEWLDNVKSDFTRWFINTYTRILGKNALSLGDEQLPYFKEIIDECEEVLR